MSILKPAAVYFAAVFGAGFLLAFVRIPFLVPRFGIRTAELLEIPVMLAVIVTAASWLRRRFLARFTPLRALAVGALALSLLLASEIIVGVALGGASARAILLDRDPVSGTAYYLSLVVFAVIPAVLVRRSRRFRT